MKCFVLIAVLALCYEGGNSQSVVQQCLTEQIRNSNNSILNNNNIINNNNNNINNNINNNNNNGQQAPTPELATLNAFRSICQNYPQYVQCFQNRLWGSNDQSDLFLSLLFRPASLTVAYRGLCANLNVVERNIRCLLSTPEVRRCYADFNNGVERVVGLQTQGQVPRPQLQTLACNVSVSRYRCETAVYRFCNQESGQVMQDFFFAGVPQECRDTAGVRSRYADRWGGAAAATGSRPLYFLTAAMMLLLTSRFL